MADAERRPRNIVLLADGTGNSAGSQNKTNVWRLYEALDLGNGDQIVRYDDGVGTSGIKPLKVLGLAIGWGVSRNVRELYEFACGHYRPGDRIHIFGFSRGAFTARCLADLIGKCGVLDRTKEIQLGRRRRLPLGTDRGLHKAVRRAYRAYRRSYKTKLTGPIRRVRDWILGDRMTTSEFKKEYAVEETTPIAALGVWDTVDAVGLPADELSTLLDTWIYPHRFPDQDLGRHVERAYHAIAIDDERHSFHPTLWNENGPRATGASPPDSESSRVLQVWFPGMHADVGGGYPEDGLAHVSLEWMIDQVGATAGGPGLAFQAERVADVRSRVNALGQMHDSRSGVGVYYRYKPRNVADLCHDQDARVIVDVPKIHRSVFDRIGYGTEGYAPTGLPERFQIAERDGRLTDPASGFESSHESASRLAVQARARDHIFWGRCLYYAMITVTAALLLLPFLPVSGVAEADGGIRGRASEAVRWLLSWPEPLAQPAFVNGL